MEELHETLRAARDFEWVPIASLEDDYFRPIEPDASFRWGEAMDALLKDIHANVMWC
jgi:hypothetical protein